MSDSELRWSDCDELAVTNPIACLLCRTSRLNDGFHFIAGKMAALEVELGSIKDDVGDVKGDVGKIEHSVSKDGQRTRRYGLAYGVLVTAFGIAMQALMRHLGL